MLAISTNFSITAVSIICNKNIVTRNLKYFFILSINDGYYDMVLSKS